jgi:alkanesulfonate monooxygenase SsuD/methylene tetrahydromethanopterin reductase-like flavin-dependent oxidoreductase (luciferase family)
MLSYAAAATERIGLGTGVVLLSVRHPVEIAQQAATLNAMSDERLSLGVSLGGRDNEFSAMGMPKEQRAGRLVEGSRLMKKLWTEKDVSFAGRYYSLENANIEPKPKRAGGIPLIFGSINEQSLKRAGRVADGWMQAARGTPETFAQAWQTVRESARSAGRDPDALHNSKLFYVNPAKDADVASNELEHYLSFYYGPNYPMEHTAFGSPEVVAKRISDFAEAGCELMILGLPGPSIEKLEILASEVMPLVSGGATSLGAHTESPGDHTGK